MTGKGYASSQKTYSQPTLVTLMPPSLVFDQPTSFNNGRYEVKRFLGEGGKKKVYLRAICGPRNDSRCSGAILLVR